MKIVTQYQALDGQIFNSEMECVEYEKTNCNQALLDHIDHNLNAYELAVSTCAPTWLSTADDVYDYIIRFWPEIKTIMEPKVEPFAANDQRRRCFDFSQSRNND